MKKPRPVNKIGRKRRTLGWTLLTLGLLVAGLWAGFQWWLVACGTDRWSCTVAFRQLTVSWSHDKHPITGLQIVYLPDELAKGAAGAIRGHLLSDPPVGVMREHWRFWVLTYSDWNSIATGGRVRADLRIALWPIPLLVWTAAALLLRSGILARRRAITGKCNSCGYDLAGLGVDAKCPECGKTKS